VLAADIGAITGTVFVDLDGDGLDATDTRLAGVTVTLFRDGGNGIFGGDDTAEGFVDSGALASATPGQYRFDNLRPGRYFVQQDNADAPAGLVNPSPVTVNIATGSVRVRAIDLFNQTAVGTIVANSAIPVTSNTAAPEAIGGQRNITVTRTGAAGNVSLDIVPGATPADPAFLAVGSSVSPGTVNIQYDGDNSSTLNRTGLGGLDLDASDTRAGLVFEIVSAVPSVGGGIDIRISTSATNFSFASITYPAAANPGPATVFVPFTAFATDALGGATGPADFTNVGAIEETITVIADQDVRISLVESARPEQVTADVRNFQPLTIGNLVFQDNNNDGIFNNADAGIVGVDVQLFKLATAVTVVNPAVDTVTVTTTTIAGGVYSFTNVEPGFYAIVIPATEFAAAATLQGFISSTPTPETAGADANVDNDDDGRAVTGQTYIASGVITLTSGGEPTVGGGNTNNTFDFGFVSNADLGITKSDAPVTVSPAGVRTATFRIDIINNGPLTATGVNVVDLLPVGFTFDSITAVPTIPLTVVGTPTVTGTPATGQSVTINLSNLGSTAGTSFNLVATIGATVFGDQTNSATVSAAQADPITTQPNGATLISRNTDTGIVDIPVNDLSILKQLETTAGVVISVSPPGTTTIRTGDTAVYRITVDNDVADSALIDDVATGVTVVDTLPVGVTFVSATLNGVAIAGSAFNTTTRQLTVPIPTVTKTVGAADATILITVTIGANTTDLIQNAAAVTNLPDTDAVTANDNASVQNGVTRAIDLAVTKAISTVPGDATAAVLGAPVTFVITVSNPTTTAASDSDARGFTVTDILPAGLTLVPGSFVAGSSGVTLVTAGQTQTFTSTNTLARGSSVSFKFNALVAQSAGTSIVNNADVVPLNTGDIDVNATNNRGTATITPARNVELVVSKDDNFTGAATATPGGNIIYTIVVNNTGASDATNVMVTDTLPAGVTATSITLNGATVTDNDPAAGVLSFSIPSLPTSAGTTGGNANALTYTVNATIGAAVAAVSITNTVVVSGGGVNDLPAGNNATVTTPLAPVFDLGIAKTGPATAIPGSTTNISYTITVSNTAGPSAAANASVVDILPTGVTFQSATLNGNAITPTIAGQQLTFTVPSVGVGSTNNQVIVINARVTDTALTGTIVNNVTVSATGETGPLANTASFTTTLSPTADIGVVKRVNSATAAPGGSLTYTIEVSNAGASTALGVTLTDTLPTGLTFTSGSGPNGQVLTATGQTVNFAAIGTLAPTTAPLTYTIIAAIGGTFTGSIENVATVATTTPEGANTLPNTARVTTTVAAVDPLAGSITGRTFRDANRNGRFDAPADVGISGVTIRLRNTGNAAILREVMTLADGTYAFTGLAAGSYEVEQVQPAGVNDGLEQAGSAANPAEIASGIIGPIVVAQGEAEAGFNFAEIEILSKRRFLASTL